MESVNFYSEIRAIRLELEAIKKDITPTPLNTAELQPFKRELTEEMVSSIDSLRSAIEGKNEPIVIFKKSFSFLNEIEQIEFVARNAMEALKRGEAPNQIYETFTNIGLIQHNDNDVPDPADYQKQLTDFWFNLNNKTLKSLGTLGSRLVSKSLKAIPEFAKVKTHYSPIPPFVSFSCEMDNTFGFDKLLEIVQDSIKETNTLMQKRS
ncbi:MAG: hypothetical protein NXI25_17905 [bacterium]|nr:hypothetical protein [bacterium]